jgi:isocitrate dehydrogenase kinase/phosphatase
MKNLEIKKTVLEIFDKLYEYNEFSEWWDGLRDVEEKKIENEVQQIIENRLKLKNK